MDDLDRLVRWEQAGGHWRVLSSTDETVVVALETCDGGEEMERIRSADPALRAHVAHVGR